MGVDVAELVASVVAMLVGLLLAPLYLVRLFRLFRDREVEPVRSGLRSPEWVDEAKAIRESVEPGGKHWPDDYLYAGEEEAGGR